MTPIHIAVILLSIAMMLVGYQKPGGNWAIFILGLFSLLIVIGVLTHFFGR